MRTHPTLDPHLALKRETLPHFVRISRAVKLRFVVAEEYLKGIKVIYYKKRVFQIIKINYHTSHKCTCNLSSEEVANINR